MLRDYVERSQASGRGENSYYGYACERRKEEERDYSLSVANLDS